MKRDGFGNILFANMIMLGAVTRQSGLDHGAMKQAMLEVIPRFREQNAASLDVGYGLPSEVALG